MRRADRLFRIVEYLKARRQPVAAQQLALELEVKCAHGVSRHRRFGSLRCADYR